MAFPIRAGVVGFGFGGRIFHTAVIHATPGLELAGIVQRNGEDAAKAYPQAMIFRSVDALLADKSISLVAVTTPNATHYPIALQALQAGKHVVIDKPLTLTSDEAAELIELARKKGLILAPYQNRRWDGDFLTVRKLLSDGVLGRVVRFESRMDRWRPEPRLSVWKDDGSAGSGTLYDLGPHLVDQALILFGSPATVSASVRAEREGAHVEDAFDLQLSYPHNIVLPGATCLAAEPGPRFVLNGTKGSYRKYGIDPQEDRLKVDPVFHDPGWGEEEEAYWGSLTTIENGRQEKRVYRTLPGDYRGYYANVRDALLGVSELEVKPEQAWRTMRILELAKESNERHAAVPFRAQF